MTARITDSYRILVADDERAVRDAYRTVIEGINPPFARRSMLEELEGKLFGHPSPALPAPTYSAVLCPGGAEAVEAIRAAGPEDPAFPVAFLDVRMPPGIDGIEAAARIRAIDPDINIVIVTGHADSHPREIAQRVPPADKLFYINKPFHKMELQQFVFALTAKWKSDRATRRANEELTKRCSELEVANQTVRVERERAEVANHAKSEFLAKMSHELRTPLNAVIGFTDVMRSETFGPIGNDRYRQYLDDITYSGTHLLGMINDLLDFSTIEIGKLRIVPEDISLDEVMESVASLMTMQAEKAKVGLRLDHRAHRVTLFADEHRLRQILLNLLSNAVKFTPPGGEVVFSSDIDDNGLSISVSDTGIGIAPEHLPSIFTPFHQIDNGHARKYEGAGLGLTIAKSLAQLQGGMLTATSELGNGTTVTLQFPADKYSVQFYLVARG